MTAIESRVTVAEDRRISGVAPEGVPPASMRWPSPSRPRPSAAAACGTYPSAANLGTSRGTARAHRLADDALDRAEDRGDELCVGRRVLRDYLVRVTRPQADAAPLEPGAAVAESFTVPEDDPATTEELLRPVVRFPTGGERMHGANPGESTSSPSVATMLAHGVTRPPTFDVARRRAPDEADLRCFDTPIIFEAVGTSQPKRPCRPRTAWALGRQVVQALALTRVHPLVKTPPAQAGMNRRYEASPLPGQGREGV